MTEEIHFYRAVGEYGFLSNLYPCRLLFECQLHRSAEHAYQYGKTNDIKIKQYILDAPTPALACIVGHGLYPWMVVPKWKDIRTIRMKLVLLAKFTQNDDLRDRLRNTGDSTLVEASRSDGFWGMGKKGNGKNMLGILLMQLRGVLPSKNGGVGSDEL